MTSLGDVPSLGIPMFSDPQTGDRNKAGAYLDEPTRCHSISGSYHTNGFLQVRPKTQKPVGSCLNAVVNR